MSASRRLLYRIFTIFVRYPRIGSLREEVSSENVFSLLASCPEDRDVFIIDGVDVGAGFDQEFGGSDAVVCEMKSSVAVVHFQFYVGSGGDEGAHDFDFVVFGRHMEWADVFGVDGVFADAAAEELLGYFDVAVHCLEMLVDIERLREMRGN